MIDLVERYFSIVVGCVMTLNIAIWHGRLKPFVAVGRITQHEVDRFTRGATIAVWLSTAAWVAVEQGLSVRIQCVKLSDWSQPGSMALGAVVVCVWVAFLRWVWGWGGEFIARVPSAFMTPGRPETEYEPLTVRLVITGVLLIGGAGAVLAGNTRPPFPGCAG